jgi:hypothetical protein
MMSMVKIWVLLVMTVGQTPDSVMVYTYPHATREDCGKAAFTADSALTNQGLSQDEYRIVCREHDLEIVE